MILPFLLLLFRVSLKAWVKGSSWIPIFENDDNLDAGTLSKKVTSFAMGTSSPL